VGYSAASARAHRSIGLPDGAAQAVAGVGLWEHRQPGERLARVVHVGGGEAGGQHDRQVGPQPPQRPRQLEPRHARHRIVRDDREVARRRYAHPFER
jgi:hypothetical protein